MLDKPRELVVLAGMTGEPQQGGAHTGRGVLACVEDPLRDRCDARALARRDVGERLGRIGPVRAAGEGVREQLEARVPRRIDVPAEQ